MNHYNLGHAIGQRITGICIGAALGLMSGGFIGLMIGAWAGHYVEGKLRRALLSNYLTPTQIQNIFFEATFAVMGKLAKADGRVTQAEINYAEQTMQRMNLVGERREQAITAYNKGKQSDVALDDVLQPLTRVLGAVNSQARIAFIEIQLGGVMADGTISANEGAILGHVCQRLGISQQVFEQILNRFADQQAFHQEYTSGQPTEKNINKAYKLLGVSPDCDDKMLKKAYRKLMSLNHPDKLMSQGVPDDMLLMAKEKTQEIQAAYEMVRRKRKATS